MLAHCFGLQQSRPSNTDNNCTNTEVIVSHIVQIVPPP
jgi:hypothetical protein